MKRPPLTKEGLIFWLQRFRKNLRAGCKKSIKMAKAMI